MTEIGENDWKIDSDEQFLSQNLSLVSFVTLSFC